MSKTLSGVVAAFFILFAIWLFDLVIILKIMLWVIAVVSILAVLITGYFWTLSTREEFYRKRSERRKADLEANLIKSGQDTWVREEIEHNGVRSVEYARLGGTRLRVNSHDHEPTPSERLFASTMLSTGQSKMIEQGQIIPHQPQPLDLLPILDTAERVLVKGASDAGKTTLLQHVAKRSEGVFIVDPHYAPDVWPVSESYVIGAGRDYGAIEVFLSQLVTELDKRYRDRASGKDGFDAITVIIDEFQSIRAECNQAGKILGTLIRESRKVGFRLFIGSHSELVKPLGLEGQGDIRDGLLIVRLNIDQITKQRTVTLDQGGGEQDCYIPPYSSDGRVGGGGVLLPKAQPTDYERKVMRLHRQGLGPTAISEEIHDWANGKTTREIAEIIAKWQP